LQTRLLHQQLKAQNASLAEEVRERTHLAEELVATNRKLKQTHAQLVHSEKMASLGQLVAGIAHEINNPLTFVASNIHVLQRTLDWLAEPTAARTHVDARARLEKALVRMNDTRIGVERIANLVLKLRTFSRLDEGGRKTVNIHESIDSVLVFFQHRMAGRIEVVRRYGARDALTCFAGELNQVFSNLIANAVEAIEGAGSITVRTEERDGSFEFSVRDTGAGIPNEIRDRIFDPFFTTKPIGQGSGLGLAICYGIIQAHGGSIELIDDGQPGTEFIARVPRLLEPARDASAFPR
jgi:two-component system NtrC family sensor kinase